MPEGPQIKGFALRGLLKYVKESSYPGGIPALLGTMDEQERAYFSDKILSSLWYPYEAFAALARAVDREIAHGDPAVMEDVGRASGMSDLGGVFKFIRSILTIQRIVNRGAAYWNRYCDTGKLQVVDSGPNHFVVQLTDFKEIDPVHCHMTRGWITGLGDGTGASDVEIRETKCVHHGDSCCEYSGRWS